MAAFFRVSFGRTSVCLVLLTALVACGGTSGSTGRSGTGDGHATGGHGGSPAGQGAGEGGGAGDTTTTAAGGQAAGPGSGGTTTSTGGTASGVAGADYNPFPIPPGSTGHPVNCNVPAVAASTTPEGRERAALIHTHCSPLLGLSCLADLFSGEVSWSAATCSNDVRAAACQLDDALEYARSIPVACDGAWRASIACAGAVDYTGACQDPQSFPLGLIPVLHLQSPAYDGEPCRPERQALQDCIDKENPWTTVTGKRGDCEYHLGASNPGVCEVFCDQKSNQFESNCTGAPGGPFECECQINGIWLGDDGYGYNPRFFGSSCADAAQRMSDGECIERVDCCFTWHDVAGQPGGCACTSDPALLGQKSCDDAAAAGHGEVVELCDRYAPFSGGLNIPRSSQ